MLPEKPAARLRPQWNYWIGGGLCFLAILSFSLGSVPIVTRLLNKPAMLKLPGRQTVPFPLPGTYVAVAAVRGLTPEDNRKVQDMEYAFSDELEKDFFEVSKFPARRFFSDKEEAQVPLFELIVKAKGKYVLSSAYPIGVEGPEVAAVLFHTDVSYIRAEFIVGALVALIFAGLGGTMIWKARKSRGDNFVNPP